MPLTPEERSLINKANASKSTGPTSAAGKARSRQNSLKHGLRAQVVALPDEDPVAVAARAESWNAYYQPQSPAAQHLVKQCIQATLLADRCNRYHGAALSAQIRNAARRCEISSEDKVERSAAKLRSKPAATTRKLWRTAAGCRWMIDRWLPLAEALDDDFGWNDAQLNEAIRLLGHSPDAWNTDPLVYTLKLFNHFSHGNAPERVIAHLLQPGAAPAQLAGVFANGKLPDQEESQIGIAQVVADVLGRLKQTEATLRQTIEEPDGAEATDRAAILTDPAEAQLFLRYQGEARALFHRSYNELIRTLKRDESGPYRAEDEGPLDPMAVDEPKCDRVYTSTDEEPRDSDPLPSDVGSEGASEVVEEAPVAAISPNEANFAACGTLASQVAAAYEADHGRKLVKDRLKTDPNGLRRSLDERRRLV